MTSRDTNEARLYVEEVDFAALALQDEDFAKVYHAANEKIDFKDPAALQQLTKSLLRRDFKLNISLPPDRLCPPVPVRYNYIYWIQQLLDTTSSSHSEDSGADRKIVGLDIGTGASAIYALLATTLRPSWTIHATDIDAHSLSFASENVKVNNLNSRIRVHRTTETSPLVPLDDLGVEKLDFTVCNPPFYSSAEDLAASAAEKTGSPSAICTGAETEMICPGGDIGFATRMLEESLVLRERVQWYTCMCGKLGSAHALVSKFKEHGIQNFAVTALTAGRKTKRWAVGWSFGDWRPRNDVCRAEDVPHGLLPTATVATVRIDGVERNTLVARVKDIMSKFDILWTWQDGTNSGIGRANGNVWSRAARRKRKRVEEGLDEEHMHVDNSTQTSKTALVIRIVVEEDCLVHIHWLQGRDSVMFESFCGMMKRSLNESPVGVASKS